jgi:hypothetical protein
MAINFDKAHEVDEDGLAIGTGSDSPLVYWCAGTGDPTGSPAPLNTWDFRQDNNTLWYKYGAGDNDWRQIRAEDITFDNTGTGITATEVQSAILQIGTVAAASAGPALTFTKGGSAGKEEFLLIGDVESNKVGQVIPFDGTIQEFYFLEEKGTGTRRLELVQRSPAITGSYTVLGEAVATGGSYFGTVVLNQSILAGTEIAVRLKSNSDDVENPVANVIFQRD